MLFDGPCEITGEPGIIDEMNSRCACLSPMMGINCDGTRKSKELGDQQFQKMLDERRSLAT